MMFCDLVDSTGVAAKLDAEEWRDLVGAYIDAASAAVVEMGGKVAKKLGDGLMALFGYPVAQENDAERTVRAALAIQRSLAELRHPIQPPLDLFRFAAPDRVGILANPGCHSLAINPLDAPIGGADVDQTLNLSLKMGPLGAVLREHPELTAAVANAVRDMLSAHLTPSWVVMPAATWIVTGRNARPSGATHQNPPL